MNPLKIVFMGSPDFAVPSLEALHESPHDIITVVSGEDKRRKRRGEPEPTAVKRRALELGLETFDAENMKSPELEEKLRSLNPDLFVVVAFKILPASLLQIPSKGSINLHASLLPKYRGAAPIHWAVIKGEKETGCTVFFLDQSVDTGRILKQTAIPISQSDTTGDIYDKLKDVGAELVADSADLIAKGAYETTRQKDSEATPAPKLFRENTKIDFSDDARNVHNLIRGLNPFPVAWCKYGDEKMNVYRSKVDANRSIPPGELRFAEGRLLAGAGNGAVELLELQLPGTKRMSGAEFANGYDLELPLE